MIYQSHLVKSLYQSQRGVVRHIPIDVLKHLLDIIHLHGDGVHIIIDTGSEHENSLTGGLLSCAGSFDLASNGCSVVHNEALKPSFTLTE